MRQDTIQPRGRGGDDFFKRIGEPNQRLPTRVRLLSNFVGGMALAGLGMFIINTNPDAKEMYFNIVSKLSPLIPALEGIAKNPKLISEVMHQLTVIRGLGSLAVWAGLEINEFRGYRRWGITHRNPGDVPINNPRFEQPLNVLSTLGGLAIGFIPFF